MPSGLSPFTTATAYLDHLAPRQSRPVQRFVPTSALAETVSPTSPEASTSTTAQEDHASQSITHFPQVHGCTGFVNARVIHAGKTLELRWLNLVQAPLSEAQEEGEDGEDHRPYEELDAYGCLAPIHFHFPDPIISSPGIFTSPSTGELTINLLTKRWTVYRLRFPAPYLFCLPEDEDFQDGWATDHEVEEVLGGKTVMLVHPIDVDNLLVFLADGGVSLLRWGRLVGLNESYGWMSAVFASGGTGAWWQKLLSVPSLPSSHASLGGGQIDASPDAAVSVASALGDGGTGENGWAFSVARDRKLRIWNLATQACVGIKDLARSARSNNVADYALVPTSGPDTPSAGAGKRPTGPPLLPPVPRTLLRYVPADEGDDAAYEGFLVAFVPSLVAPVFVTYGVSLSRDRRTSELVLLEERDCSDLWARGERQGDLRDFGVAKVDPTVGVETPQEQRAWTLWTVWDEATTTGGPGNVIRFVPLTETRAWQTATPEPPGWTTISPPRTETWDPAFFDEALSDGTKGVPEVFLEYILKPGRYAPSTLKYALDTYSEPLYHDRSVSRSNAIDLDFSTVEERIAAVVGSTIRLETSPQTGTPLYDAFRKRLQGEWLRFTAMCEESRRAALWTVELALDDDRELAVLFGRACVALPVAREAAVALAEASEREPQALVVEGDPWPVLGESDAREDLVRLVTASSTLANSIPKDLLLGLEADLLQAVREPLTSSFDSIADSLASDALIAAVAEARDVWQSSAAAITDPQSGLKSLCQVVTSTELLRPPANIGVVTTSVLSQALIADSATVSIETRFDLTRNAALFLLVLREEDGVEADALPPLMGALFAALHALGTLRWITLQPTTATVSRTSLQGNEDSLADQLESLQMGDQTAAELSATSSAFSLLTSLMALSHSPGYVVSSPPPLALTHALSSFLESTGLLSERNTVTTTLADVVFVQQLVNMGLPELALAVIGMYPVNAGLKYLEGAARTALGQVEDAEDAFRKAACALCELSSHHASGSTLTRCTDEDSARLDDDACLVPVLPIDCPSTPSGYYRHVATVFDEQAEADLAVAHFCELALSVTDDPQGQQLADRTAEELWARLFQAYSGLGLFEDAYKTLMRIPAEELCVVADLVPDDLADGLLCRKYACLRQLVQNMCEASQVDALLRFPFGDLQNKLEDALSWRARNSDPRSTPSYFGILYVYHSGRGDYRSGASWSCNTSGRLRG